MVTLSQRREGVHLLKARGVSERRGCSLCEIGRSSFRYLAVERDESELISRLLKIARRRKRFGYRRAHALLVREGLVVNHKRIERLWRILGLTLPKRRPRKKRKARGGVPLKAVRPNHVWTYDFVFDTTQDGRKLKFLTLVDEFTRESLAIEVGRSISARSVIVVLKRVINKRGAPEFIRSDNGPEFIAEVLRRWLKENRMKTQYIDPGKPWQNAYGESFNGRFRDEFLNVNSFAGLHETRVMTEIWRKDYNGERPHSSLGYATPNEFKAAFDKRRKTKKL